MEEAAGATPALSPIRRANKLPIDLMHAGKEPDLPCLGILRDLRVAYVLAVFDGFRCAEGENVIGSLCDAIGQFASASVSRIGNDDPAAFQNTDRCGVMLVRIVKIQLCKAKILAWRFGAFGIQLLDVDLTHIVHIGNICHTVVADHGTLVDPPFGVCAFDALHLRSFHVDHIECSFIFVFFIITHTEVFGKPEKQTKRVDFRNQICYN